MNSARQSYMKRPSALHPVLPEIAEEPFRGWSFDGVRSPTEPTHQFNMDAQRPDYAHDSAQRGTPSRPARRGSLAAVSSHRSTASLDLARNARASFSASPSRLSPPTKSSFADSSSDEDEDRSTAVRRPLSLARKFLNKPKQRGVSISGPTDFRRVSVAACESDGDDNNNDDDEDGDGFSSVAPSKAAKLLGLGAVEPPATSSSPPKLSRSTSISSASTTSPRTPGSRYSSPLVQMASSPLAPASRSALNPLTVDLGVGLGIALPPHSSAPTATLSYNRSRRPKLVGVSAPQPILVSDPALVALQRAAAAATMTATDPASTTSQPLAPSRSHTSPELSRDTMPQRRPTLSKRSCSDGSLSSEGGPACTASLAFPPSSSSRDSSSSSYSSGSSYSTYSSSSSSGAGGMVRPLSHISTRSSTDEGSREIAAVLRYLDGGFSNSPTTANTPASMGASVSGGAVVGVGANVSVGLDVEQQEQDDQQRQRQRESKKTGKHGFHGVSVPGWNFL